MRSLNDTPYYFSYYIILLFVRTSILDVRSFQIVIRHLHKTIVLYSGNCYNTCMCNSEEYGLYRVAGIVFEARDCGSVFSERAAKYRVDRGEPEFTLTLTDEDMRCFEDEPRLTEEGFRYIMSGLKFYFELIKRGGLMLHSSAVVRDGRAYLFSGPSGIGKSTHTGYWLELFPEAYILNDDKPAIIKTESGFTAFGTPWSGKYDISRNEGVRIGGIGFIERSDEDRIERLDTVSAIAGIMSQTVRHVRRERMEELLSTVEALIAEVPVYRVYCTNSVSAAKCASRAMCGDE